MNPSQVIREQSQGEATGLSGNASHRPKGSAHVSTAEESEQKQPLWGQDENEHGPVQRQKSVSALSLVIKVH